MRSYFTSTKSSLARGGSQLISNTLIPLISVNQSLPNALESNKALKASSQNRGFELHKTQQDFSIGMQEMHRNMFIGKWIGGYGQQEQKEEPLDIDISDIEFEGEEMGWGGMTRPGSNWDREFSDEEGMNENTGISDNEHTDSDDDHHGGEMMPIPRLF